MKAKRARFVVSLLLSLLLTGDVCAAQAGGSLRLQRAVRDAGASVVVLDVRSGRRLMAAGDAAGAVQRSSAPGSVLKPLVLMLALQNGAVREHETVACSGSLRIQGHNLACSHPRDITVLDARQALASSCNAYFAAVARRMATATLVGGLRAFGVAPLRAPPDGDGRALLGLGLRDVLATPAQIGEAYRRLALEMNAGAGQPGQGSNATRVVREGMLQSVETGMAHAARVAGVRLGGKTGTVDDSGGRSHGWFAGIVFRGSGADASRPSTAAERVVVVFVANGNGADAAALARLVVLDGAGTR